MNKNLKAERVGAVCRAGEEGTKQREQPMHAEALVLGARPECMKGSVAGGHEPGTKQLKGPSEK